MADMGVRDRRHELRKLALYRRRSSGWPRRSTFVLLLELSGRGGGKSGGFAHREASAHGTVLAVHLSELFIISNAGGNLIGMTSKSVTSAVAARNMMI